MCMFFSMVEVVDLHHFWFLNICQLDHVMIIIFTTWITPSKNDFVITLAKQITFEEFYSLIHVMMMECFQTQNYGFDLKIIVKVNNVVLGIQHINFF